MRGGGEVTSVKPPGRERTSSSSRCRGRDAAPRAPPRLHLRAADAAGPCGRRASGSGPAATVDFEEMGASAFGRNGSGDRPAGSGTLAAGFLLYRTIGSPPATSVIVLTGPLGIGESILNIHLHDKSNRSA